MVSFLCTWLVLNVFVDTLICLNNLGLVSGEGTELFSTIYKYGFLLFIHFSDQWELGKGVYMKSLSEAQLKSYKDNRHLGSQIFPASFSAETIVEQDKWIYKVYG